MMWHVFVPAWVALLEADPELTAALGLDDDGEIPIYRASAARKHRVPSIEYIMPDDRETELFNPVIFQVDYWAYERHAALIERRIRRLTHRDVARRFEVNEYETLYMWTRFIRAVEHEYPAEQGVVYKSLDFQFEPLRARFHT
jgi:hypothetical protein